MIRILGIDPGSQITGYGLIEAHNGRLLYVDSGCIRVRSRAMPQRIGEIFAAVGELVALHRPQVLAIECVFMHRNPDSALKLGQARGAAICAAVERGLAVSEYTPSQIKQAVVGRGQATKPQVQHMVRALLSLPGAPQADAADALAVAVCHAHTGDGLARIALAQGGRRR